MRDEFGFDTIRSVEFCVSVVTGRDDHVNYLVPIDRTVQDALKDVLNATVAEIETPDARLTEFDLSEKYGSRECPGKNRDGAPNP